MSLKAYKLFCNLFIIGYSIRLDVSKKSTASSILCDIGEDKRLIDFVLFLGYVENQ